MQNPLAKLTHASLYLLIALSFVSPAVAQTDSCGARYGGSTQAGLPCCGWQSVIDAWCNTTPTDLTFFQNGPVQVTCRGCFPGNAAYPAPQFSKGGTASCTRYDKQMVIEFSQPVADLQWAISGARMVTDNRGYTVQLDPNGQVARFPGSGITSITISDPREYNPDGSPQGQGFWEMDAGNVSWSLGSDYDQCNCSRPAMPGPPTQNVTTAWPFDLSGVDPNWSMLVQMTSNDGLVLRDIKLGQRYMVEKINVPYFYLETSALEMKRGELKPDGLDAQMRSRLVNFYSNTDETKLVIEATYVIDQIPAGSQSCLEITQRYEFYRFNPVDKCEPSGKLDCSRWKPIVKYRFTGRNGEFLKSINIAQRQHRMVDNNSYNTVGLFRDQDEALPFTTIEFF